jgi:hypothetical protein
MPLFVYSGLSRRLAASANVRSSARPLTERALIDSDKCRSDFQSAAASSSTCSDSNSRSASPSSSGVESGAAGDGQIPAAFDEFSDPLVIALLGAGRGPHAADHRPVAHVPQLLRDDVRRRVGVTTTRARKSELSVRTAPLATLGRQKLRRFTVAQFLRPVQQIVQ